MPDIDDRDCCDRCDQPADRVNVGWSSVHGYDGLCDPCLDTLQAEARQATITRTIATLREHGIPTSQ